MSGPSFIAPHLWRCLGLSLGHSLWIGVAVILLDAVLRPWVRRMSPAFRYGHSLTLLALLGLAPLVVLGGLMHSLEELPSGTEGLAIEPALVESVETVAIPAVAIPAVASEAGAQGIADGLVTLLPWLWCLGVLVFAAVTAVGLRRVHALKSEGRRLISGEVSDLCRRLSREIGVAGRVAVATSSRLASPVVVGVLRPLILLPAAVLVNCTPRQIEMILIHELGHVRRHDNLVLLLQRTLEIVLFYHPAVWILSRRVSLEREHCCDQRVLLRGHDRRAYAQTLLTLSQPTGLASRRPVAALARHGLVERVRRILELEDRSVVGSKRLNPLASAFALLVLVAGVGFAQEAQSRKQEKTRCERCRAAEAKRAAAKRAPARPHRPARVRVGAPPRPLQPRPVRVQVLEEEIAEEEIVEEEAVEAEVIEEEEILDSTRHPASEPKPDGQTRTPPQERSNKEMADLRRDLRRAMRALSHAQRRIETLERRMKRSPRTRTRNLTDVPGPTTPLRGVVRPPRPRGSRGRVSTPPPPGPTTPAIQCRVVGVGRKSLTLGSGWRAGIRPGQRYRLFRGSSDLGDVTVSSVGSTSATALIMRRKRGQWPRPGDTALLSKRGH